MLFQSFIIFLSVLLSDINLTEAKMEYVYNVSRLTQSIDIDADWEKPQWQGIEAVVIENYIGAIPGFRPYTEVKMMYDHEHIYVIFRVNDKYVMCENMNINDPVWQDSAVEFFFAPDKEFPKRYFNLEVNCGGTPLMNHNVVPREKFVRLEADDIKKIQIASSLPKKVYPEIKEEVSWTIEYKIPFGMLEKYAKLTRPDTGVTWKANFYKIAVNTSSPHFITWSPITNDKLDFHQPEFFGNIVFK
jgi:hypothetical protein